MDYSKKRKRKTPRPIQKIKEEAFILSKTNRTESDKLEQEAYEISKKIDLLDQQKS